MMGIMQYTHDYDEKMPLAIRTRDSVGPKMIGLGTPVATEEFGVKTLIMPYVKSDQLFQCPNDNGFRRYAPTANGAQAGGVNVPNGAKVWEAYGTSYKFTGQNFSQLPSSAFGSVVWPKIYRVRSSGDLVKIGGHDNVAAGSVEPPFPVSVAFYARPAETRVMRCYFAPWEPASTTSPDLPNLMHNSINVVAFADGHVKAITSQSGFNALCDGPTWSPSHVEGAAGGDGSCNTMGLERRSK